MARPWLPIPAAVLAAAAACTSFSENFYEVERGRFYRSAQPDRQQLTRRIWQHEIETVLRVRAGAPGDEDYEASRTAAEAAGVDFVQVPLSASDLPSRAALVELCDVLEHGRYPMLVHCQAGADRTGFVAALYVLQTTGDLDAARAELAFFPFGHLPWFGSDMPERLLARYEPHLGAVSFCEWARTQYDPEAPR